MFSIPFKMSENCDKCCQVLFTNQIWAFYCCTGVKKPTNIHILETGIIKVQLFSSLKNDSNY